jgi:hypothetical protein
MSKLEIFTKESVSIGITKLIFEVKIGYWKQPTKCKNLEFTNF